MHQTVSASENLFASIKAQDDIAMSRRGMKVPKHTLVKFVRNEFELYLQPLSQIVSGSPGGG